MGKLTAHAETVERQLPKEKFERFPDGSARIRSWYVDYTKTRPVLALRSSYFPTKKSADEFHDLAWVDIELEPFEALHPILTSDADARYEEHLRTLRP